MIDFSSHQLANGLRLLLHEDDSTPMVAVNILYKVGSRDESSQRTGFAHLFEHLMFGGSANVPDFDLPLQMAGGENNAFTNTDITNFYNTVPAQNIETVFWLESDRMASLKLNKKNLDIQRKVVIEEFKETCLNQPYGDVWHQLLDLTYTTHPYRWPTIGLEISHIQHATLDDVKHFFSTYYLPNNAIMTIVGNIKTEKTIELVEKWFGNIPSNHKNEYNKNSITIEPKQTAFRSKQVVADVPSDAIYLAFHVASRHSPDFFATDMLSDVLSNGDSSRLYRQLKKERKLFSDIDAYTTGTFDAGLLVIEGKLTEGVSMEQAQAAIWEVLDDLKNVKILENELQKHKNKLESSTVFSECNFLNKAINLAFYEAMGDAKLINEEITYYLELTTDDLQRVANDIFRQENCSALYYFSKNNNT